MHWSDDLLKKTGKGFTGLTLILILKYLQKNNEILRDFL
jgi:hypothetical protein